MQAVLKERLRQGKAKIILDQNIINLEATTDVLYYIYNSISIFI